MTPDEIKSIQLEVGTKPDGIWGPHSKTACQKYLRSLWPTPYPWPTQANRVAFYGLPGTGFTRIDVTGLGMKYDGETIYSIMCHQKVATDLLAILKEIANSADHWVLADYGGCYAAKALMHGHAAAIDLDVAKNDMHVTWPDHARMPWNVIKIFSRHGWTSAAGFWNYDAMHFQATSW